jgi:hypothetical protein
MCVNQLTMNHPPLLRVIAPVNKKAALRKNRNAADKAA